MQGAGFSKSERLSQKKLIASLFEAGQSFFRPPLTVIWMETPLPENTPAQILISISKKNLPHATDRNRVRRVIREAYRKNKLPLYQHLSSAQKQVAIAIIYGSKKITTFNRAEDKIKVALSELIQLTSNKS